MSTYPPRRPAFTGRRLRAISTPCPFFVPLSPRAASIIGCGLLAAIYLAWTIVLFKGHSQLNELKLVSTGTATSELGLMGAYCLFVAFFAATYATVSFGAFVTSIFPQRDFAKWFSRTIWFGWLASWALGIFGAITYVSSDAFLAAGCLRGNECWEIRQRLQVWIIVCLFATLLFGFYFGVILSAFSHTLHPHLFRSPDSDTEDEYSDPEFEAEQALDEELRRSGHPYAAEALAARALERIDRSQSRRRHGWQDDEEKDDYPKNILLSEGKRQPSSRAGPSRIRAPAHTDEDSLGSSEDEEREQQTGLISSPGRQAGPARRLSSIADDYDSEDEARPPSYTSRERSARRESRAGMEEKSLGRSRSRSRSQSRGRR
ncbi:hypothetical protein JCM10213_001489 [Rhodosporidiobolus nylandii]